MPIQPSPKRSAGGAVALALVFIAACVTDAAEEQYMPLDELAAGLAANSPAFGDPADRLPYIDALDAWINRPDTVYWTLEPAEANRDFQRYYLNAIDRALTEAERTVVTRGAVVWKLYSSGFLVRTPTAVFAFDAVEGPFKSITHSPDDEPRFIFKWTQDMRRRFVQLVDVLLITHRHYDHASFALARQMIEAGKIVIVPSDLKDKYWANQTFTNGLTVLSNDRDQRIGPLTVSVFHGVQAMSKPEGNRFAVNFETDPLHKVYLVRADDDLSFLHNGDNRGLSFVPWLRSAVDDG